METSRAVDPASGTELPGAPFVAGEVGVDGFSVAYAEAGQGPVLVSLPGSAGIEMSVSKDLLARRFRVVEINPPGWGPRDDVQGVIDQKDLAHLLARAIEALGIERYHLVGNSMGGVNALWLTLHYPSRVKSLVLDASMTFMSPEHAHHPGNDAFIAALRAGKVPTEEVRKILANLPPAPRYPQKPWMDQAYFAAQMADRFRMFSHVTSSHEDELNARVGSVACPVLAVLGDADEILKSSIRANYAAYMPQADFQLIAVGGGGHDLQGSRPIEFAQLVQQFLDASESKDSNSTRHQ